MGRLPLPILRDVRSRIIVVILPAKRIRNEEEEQNTDVVTLPNELWMRAFTYLDQKDLFLIANVNRKFLSASSADLLWKVICHQRWKNKRFNVHVSHGGLIAMIARES